MGIARSRHAGFHLRYEVISIHIAVVAAAAKDATGRRRGRAALFMLLQRGTDER